MKIFAFIFGVILTSSVFAAGEKKEVCNDKLDSKGNVVKKADGTVVRECKTITVHKKVEGEKVPEKK
jgi:hypothetical protein